MELSLTSLKTRLGKFLARFHVLVFTVLILGGLIVAMLLINATIGQSDTSSNYTPPSANTTFDQQTIDRIEKLHSASDNATSTLDLSGRVNPFED